MNNRKAFTLMELLVVIGIIAILSGILLPAINHMRRSAQITAAKADLQAIATALDAYKADFGDYPRNVVLPKWNTLTPPEDPNGRAAAPIYLSLASALLGAGPGITQSGSIYQIGDGADGLGFRNQVQQISINVTALAITSSPYSVTIQGPYPPELYNFVPLQTLASITMSIGTQIEETVGISAVDVTSGKLTLATAPIFISTAPPNITASHVSTAMGDKYVLKIATGKITPNYLAADTFKVAFVPAPNTAVFGGPATNTYGSAGQPVLLDRWGQVIQYFPRYGVPSNRTIDATPYNIPDRSVATGPLYGYSEAWSVENRNPLGNGQFSLFDFRDGTPIFNDISQSAPGETWLPQATPLEFDKYFDPSMAIMWMLGDTQINAGTGKFSNVIKTPDRLSYDGPYILISAGPNGPNQSNGGFCNLSDVSGKPLAANQWQKKFQDSGNIYNFDRP